MRRIVFDVEADGLLGESSQIWVVVAKDIDTNEMFVFEPGDTGWQDLLLGEDVLLINHNLIGYDLALFKKLYGLKAKGKFIDTLLWSQILDYKRFGSKGHSLKVWGEYLGHPKVEHEDWTQYSPEMLHRCKKDVELTEEVFRLLWSEFDERPGLASYIRAEHAAAEWISDASLNGWRFDVDAAADLHNKLEPFVEGIRTQLEEKLGDTAVAVDKYKGEVLSKSPKWNKQGFYHASTAKWFGVDPVSGYEGEERLIEGDYCRVTFRSLSLSSTDDVKVFLFRNGWEPTDYNHKWDPETRSRIRTSPKITEDSLEFLGGDGKLYHDYTVASSRLAILKTWLNSVDENGYLHGDCLLIGTPSMRARHRVITNVPGSDSAWGPEMRSLFICPPGWKIIGVDSKGNQARGLAHDLGDPEFERVILEEDIHTYNQWHIDNALESIGLERGVTRAASKRIFYAFIFGASGGKLLAYATGIFDEELGGKFKAGFMKSVPGLSSLIKSLGKSYGATSKNGAGWIHSIVGNKLYVDSWHKILVYRLQATEKITCSCSLMVLKNSLEREKIPYKPLIYYHDETQFMVPEEYAERAAGLGVVAFAEGPKLVKVEIMGGDSKIGNNWLETH